VLAGANFGQDAQKKSELVPPPGPQPMLDFSYFDYWCLYLRSFSINFVDQKLPNGQVIQVARLTYVLEFTRDVQYLQLEPLMRNYRPENKRMRHLFYDSENVAINGEQFMEYKIQGEISGMQGEAFRVTVEFVDDPRFPLRNAKKLVVRAWPWDQPR
jgi:hypothetical protein